MIVYVRRINNGIELSSYMPSIKAFYYTTSSVNKALKMFRLNYNLARKHITLVEVIDREKPEKHCCSICGHLTDEANNAEPVKSGTCCNRCNFNIVLPVRIKIAKAKLDARNAATDKINELRAELAKAHEAMRPLAEYILEGKK